MSSKLLLALPVAAIALSAGCGYGEAPQPEPEPAEPQQVSVVEPADDCPPSGISLRRTRGC
jgi:hypothetical protein